MRKICLTTLLFWFAAVAGAAPVYQLPGVAVCVASACALRIDNDGYLRDTVSHEVLFEFPFSRTIFDDYVLLKSGEQYIVERSNMTSSKNWDLLLFTYDGKSARAERVISLSKGVDMVSPEIHWEGYECRGRAAMPRQFAPFEAARTALCGGIRAPDSPDPDVDPIDDTASKTGLVVRVPVYGTTRKETAVYFFPDADEPDAGSLLCLHNCGPENNNVWRYGGWIGDNSWIDVTLCATDRSSTVQGSYFYIGKTEAIYLTGSYENKRLVIRQFSRNEHLPTAAFEGSGSRDSIMGNWRPATSGQTHNFFLASRIF